MPSAEKIEKVAGLKERIKAAEALLLAEYRGLSVHDATELRRSLAGQARFAIVKNTLMERAAADAGVEGIRELLDGPTAVAFVKEDAVAAAKTIVDAAKRFPALVLKGGLMDGRLLSAAEARALATLDSRDVMLSKLAGMMKGEMARAASAFQAVQGRFLGVLEAYAERLEPEVAATEPEPAEGAATESKPAEAAATEPEPKTANAAATESETADGVAAETDQSQNEPEEE